MSSTKPSRTTPRISPIVIPVLFGTYFLTVQTIEYSLSTYVLNENHLDLFKKYLIFKANAPIWKWWHMFTLVTLPPVILKTVTDVLHIFTKKKPIKHHLVCLVQFIQLFSRLYITFTRAVPLEKKLTEISSRENVLELNSYHSMLLVLILIAWFIPIVQYKQMQEVQTIEDEKKEQ